MKRKQIGMTLFWFWIYVYNADACDNNMKMFSRVDIYMHRMYNVSLICKLNNLNIRIYLRNIICVFVGQCVLEIYYKLFFFFENFRCCVDNCRPTILPMPYKYTIGNLFYCSWFKWYKLVTDANYFHFDKKKKEVVAFMMITGSCCIAIVL